MAAKSVAPSIKETAFDCPHCGAYTTQFWYDLHAKSRPNDSRTPPPPLSEVSLKKILGTEAMPKEDKDAITAHQERLRAGLVFLGGKLGDSYSVPAFNLHLSGCYNCKKIAVWVSDRLLFPPQKTGAAPNPDLPEDVLHDYEEARSILDLSPRGAAALLRLCVQKLCIHLGEKGENINADIASLVAKGLNVRVQKSLDSVRVIGNEAVHPGVLDLNDNRDIASGLFVLVNIIAEQMISLPKHVDDVYAKLPAEKLEAIEKRDAKGKPDAAG